MSGLSPSATCYNIFLRALSARPSFVAEKWRQTSQTRDNPVVTNQCQLNQSSTQLRQRVSRSDTRYNFVQIFILFCHSICNDDDTSPRCTCSRRSSERTNSTSCRQTRVESAHPPVLYVVTTSPCSCSSSAETRPSSCWRTAGQSTPSPS